MCSIDESRCSIYRIAIAPVVFPLAWVMYVMVQRIGGAIQFYSEHASLHYFIATTITCTLFIMIAFIFKKRAMKQLSWLVLIIQICSVLILTLAIGPRLIWKYNSVGQFKILPVQQFDTQRFGDYARVSPSFKYLYVRNSWIVDEYGSTTPFDSGNTWEPIIEDYGFPLRCIHSPSRYLLDVRYGFVGIGSTGFWEFFSNIQIRIIPFAANTSILTAIVLTFLLLPNRIRSWMRLRADCCVNCGYSITKISGSLCPECGSPITAKKKTVPHQ